MVSKDLTMPTHHHPAKAAANAKEWIVEPVSAQIKASRQHAGLTQCQAAEKTGCTQAYISKIESGRQVPTVRVLLIFCEVYNCQIIISK